MGFAVKPKKTALGKDGIWMWDGPGLLACEHMAKLRKKGFAVDLDGRWLGGDEQGVLSRACQLFFPLGVASAGRERQIVVNDETVVLGAILLKNPFDLTESVLTIWQVTRQILSGFDTGGLAQKFDSKRHLNVRK